MKFGKILTYENRNEAEIGKRYVFCDTYKYLCVCDKMYFVSNSCSDLKAVRDQEYPFENDRGASYQFIREVIDEPVMMTYLQLTEWLAKGNGLAMDKDSDVATSRFMCPISMENKQLSGEVLLIRPWGSEEWVKPTIDIYERDCR